MYTTELIQCCIKHGYKNIKLVGNVIKVFVHKI